jgi:hypothetical protein
VIRHRRYILLPLDGLDMDAKKSEARTQNGPNDDCALSHSVIENLQVYNSGAPGIPAIDLGVVCDSTLDQITATGPNSGIRVGKAKRDYFGHITVDQNPPPTNLPIPLQSSSAQPLPQ